MNNLTLDSLAARLLEHRDFVVTAHISPDPDAIGSACALALSLKQLGKDVRVYFADPVPDRMKALVPAIEISNVIPAGKFETLVVCDTASKKRVGPEMDTLFACAEHTFNIDHHVSNDGWAALNYIDAAAPATALIIFELLPHLRTELTPEIANLLLAGLLDDTGTFCFSNTTPRAFECASALVKAGAKPHVVANELYFTQPLRVLKLRAEALESLEVLLDGRLSYIVVTRAMIEAAGAKPDDTEGMIEAARMVAGVEVAVLQRELEDGWKFSLRAKNEKIDVNKIAGLFGGGGHRAAAGAKLTGSAAEVKKVMVDAIAKELGDVR